MCQHLGYQDLHTESSGIRAASNFRPFWKPKLVTGDPWPWLLLGLGLEKGTHRPVLCLQVVPMLPRLLCEELCSLNPMTDKLTFSVIWTLTPEGKVTSH